MSGEQNQMSKSTSANEFNVSRIGASGKDMEGTRLLLPQVSQQLTSYSHGKAMVSQPIIGNASTSNYRYTQPVTQTKAASVDQISYLSNKKAFNGVSNNPHQFFSQPPAHALGGKLGSNATTRHESLEAAKLVVNFSNNQQQPNGIVAVNSNQNIFHGNGYPYLLANNLTTSKISSIPMMLQGHNSSLMINERGYGSGIPINSTHPIMSSNGSSFSKISNGYLGNGTMNGVLANKTLNKKEFVSENHRMVNSNIGDFKTNFPDNFSARVMNQSLGVEYPVTDEATGKLFEAAIEETNGSGVNINNSDITLVRNSASRQSAVGVSPAYNNYSGETYEKDVNVVSQSYLQNNQNEISKQSAIDNNMEKFITKYSAPYNIENKQNASYELSLGTSKEILNMNQAKSLLLTNSVNVLGREDGSEPHLKILEKDSTETYGLEKSEITESYRENGSLTTLKTGKRLNEDKGIENDKQQKKLKGDKSVPKRELCHICNQSFSNLKTHISSHMKFENRPFQCDFCKRGFARNNDLQRHRKKHLLDDGTRDTVQYLSKNFKENDHQNREIEDGLKSIGADLNENIVDLIKTSTKKNLNNICATPLGFQCPFFKDEVQATNKRRDDKKSPASEGDKPKLEFQNYDSEDYGVYVPAKCHTTGIFTRCDTFKNHLKALHFSYPRGTTRKNRPSVPGHCIHCSEYFENSKIWVDQHILKGKCLNNKPFKSFIITSNIPLLSYASKSKSGSEEQVNHSGETPTTASILDLSTL